MKLSTYVTSLAAGLLVLYCVLAIPLPAPRLWAVRLGLVLFLLGSAVGGLMVNRRGHAVGVPDGGPGLPFVNWSTEGGDLRIAHALGLHALQVLPLAAWAFGRLTRLDETKQTVVVFAFGALYALVSVAAFTQALDGRPVVKGLDEGGGATLARGPD